MRRRGGNGGRFGRQRRGRGASAADGPGSRAVLGAWIVGGVYLVSRALTRGDATDAGISPYHVVAYAGLLVLVGLSTWLVVRAVRRGRPWRDAFPAGSDRWAQGRRRPRRVRRARRRLARGRRDRAGDRASFAPSRVILVVGLALVAMAPLRAALLATVRGDSAGPPRSPPAGRRRDRRPRRFQPDRESLLEKAPDAVEDNAEIWLMDAGGGRQTRLVEAAAGVEALLPAWSPDGSQIAVRPFQGPPDDPEHADYDIWVVNADGTDAHAVATGPSWQWLPRWSPDGSWIAYTDEAVGGPWLSSGSVGPAVGQGRKAGLSGRESPRASPKPTCGGWRQPAEPRRGSPTRPATTGPDRGRRTAGASRSTAPATATPSCTPSTPTARTSVRLTDNPAEDWAASWSPDGSRIAFTSNRTGHRPDLGHGRRRLRPDAADRRPDRRALAGLVAGRARGSCSRAGRPAGSRHGRWPPTARTS
jgi:hypothetical protein